MEAGSPTARAPLDTLERACLPVAIAAALVFAFVGLGRSAWLDEAYSAMLASRSLPGVIDGLRNDANFPLYFVLLAGWTRLAGLSEIAVRIPSVLFYLAGIVATGALSAVAFRDRRAGAWAAFFFLVSQIAFRHAQNARPYALLGLLVAAAHVLYLRAFFRDDASWRWRAAFAAVTVLGTFTHAWYLFVAAAHGLGLLLCGSRRRFATGALTLAASLAPFALLWLPTFIGQVTMVLSSWIRAMRYTADLLLYDFYHPHVTWMLLAALPILLLVARRRTVELARERPAIVLALLGTVSVAIPLTISLWHPIYVPDRYAIVALPPLAALLGAIVSRLSIVPVRLALAAVALGITLHSHVSTREKVVRYDRGEGQSDRATSRYVLEHARRGDVLCFTSLSRVTMDYYLLRGGASTRFVERTFPSEIDAHPCWRVLCDDRKDFAPLQAEADALAAEIEKLARSTGARVWLFFGDDLKTSWLLRRELERRLVADEVLPLAGSLFTQIRTYRAPP